MNVSSKASNADMEAVKEVLRAATRGPLDPDLELAVTLFELSDSDEAADAEAALVRLAHGARSNPR